MPDEVLGIKVVAPRPGRAVRKVRLDDVVSGLGAGGNQLPGLEHPHRVVVNGDLFAPGEGLAVRELNDVRLVEPGGLYIGEDGST